MKKWREYEKLPDALFDELCRKQARFSSDHSKTIADANPTIPENLNDREQDNWEPLLAIADAVGGHWPETARRAAVELSQNEDDQSSIAIQLLSDIRQIFSEKDIDEHLVCGPDRSTLLLMKSVHGQRSNRVQRSRQDRWPPSSVVSTSNQNR